MHIAIGLQPVLFTYSNCLTDERSNVYCYIAIELSRHELQFMGYAKSHILIILCYACYSARFGNIGYQNIIILENHIYIPIIH